MPREWRNGATTSNATNHCRKRGCSLHVPRAKLEDSFTELLRQVRRTPALIELFSEVVRDLWGKRHVKLKSRRLMDLEQKKARLLEAYLSYER